MAQEFLTPVGRIVWGHPRIAKKKTGNDNKPIIKDGKEVPQWSFGLAIPKNEFAQFVWPYLDAESKIRFPNGLPQGYALKYKDGDGVDRKGKPFADRQGYAGCYVLSISTEAYAPEVFKREQNGFRSMADNEIKCGDFVSVALIVKDNGATGQLTPGLYVNPKAIQFVAYGEEIINGGADADELFGQTNFAIPQGGSATPLAPVSNVVSPVGGMPQGQPMQQPVQYQQPVQQVQQPMQQPVQYQQPVQAAPAMDFVQNAGMPQGQPMQQPVQYQQQPVNTGMPQGQPVNAGMPNGMPQGR